MSELQIYRPIEEVQSIITLLASDVYNNQTYLMYLDTMEKEGKHDIIERINSTFSEIRVFNSNDHPLFLAKDIGILVGVRNIKAIARTFNDTEKVVGYIERNGKLYEEVFLTNNGVMRAAFYGKQLIAEVVRGFIYKLVSYMQEYELDIFHKIADDFTIENPELIRQSMNELFKTMKRYQQLYEKEQQAHIYWEKQATEEHDKYVDLSLGYEALEMDATYDKSTIEQLSMDKMRLENKLRAGYTTSIDREETEVAAIKRHCLKAVGVYAVHPEYLRKVLRVEKGKDVDITHIIDEYAYEYRYIDVDDIKLHESTQLYLMLKLIQKNTPLKSSDFMYLTTVYVYDKTAYEELKLRLRDECTNVLTNKSVVIFNTSIEHINTIEHDVIMHFA